MPALRSLPESRPRRGLHPDYEFNVFINCPFDNEYKPLLRAIIFTIHACGFLARCGDEVNDPMDRFTRIIKMIGECKLGIHDLSRIEPMPRNNMPLELGIFIGCRFFGNAHDFKKDFLVLEKTEHRLRQHTSDLNGIDPLIHDDNEQSIIKCIRNWLAPRYPDSKIFISGHEDIWSMYRNFKEDAPIFICRPLGLRFDDLEFNEYRRVVIKWLEDESQKKTDEIIQAQQSNKKAIELLNDSINNSQS